MNTGFLLLLAIGAGSLIPLQTALNARLGRFVGNPVLTTTIVFAVGIVASGIVLAAMRPSMPTSTALRDVPPVAWLGGMLGMIYIVLLVFLAPRLGVGLTTALVLIGQLLTALTLDHFGALGVVQHAINPYRVGGLMLMSAGVYLIKAY